MEADVLEWTRIIAASRSRQPQTFVKVGPRNAMVIAVLAVVADRERGEIEGRVRVRARRTAPQRPSSARGESFPTQVASREPDLDDVRGTAAYRRHALRVLAHRAREVPGVRNPCNSLLLAGQRVLARNSSRSTVCCLERSAVAAMRIGLNVNGEHCDVEAWAGESLLTTLRDRPSRGSKNAW